MSDDLHEHDILAWGEQQAALLSRLAGGERVNAVIDWQNVIEEVQDLGLSELRACRSLLRQIMLHLMKLGAGRTDPAAHWRGEIIGFLAEAFDSYTPSMRQRLDLDLLYRQARRQFLADMQASGVALPADCPFELPDLLTGDPDIDALVAKLAGPA